MMHILVDTNILLDYCFGKEYAVNFFAEAKRERYPLYVLEDVYAEARALTHDFEPIKKLFNDFLSFGLYNKVKTSRKLNVKTEDLSKKCELLIGHDLDRTDRKIISYSKTHEMYILTKDLELRQVAKAEGCHILAL